MKLIVIVNPIQNTLKAQDTTDIYTDLNGLKSLKASARKDARSALPEVARQFESVMISMMLKNLRKTGLEDPYFKSEAMDSYRDMHDKQLSMELSKGRGIGLAEAIVRQMENQVGTGNKATDMTSTKNLHLPDRRHFPDHYLKPEKAVETKMGLINTTSLQKTADAEFKSPEHFVNQLWGLAEKTAKKLGVTPGVVISQAALETGWGKYVISNDQQSSFNLFNIKAGSDWQGKRMEKVSMEYVHGKPVQQKSEFRAYDSFEQSFEDYARFVQENPRYAIKSEQSLHDKNYINILQKGGYATDPDYSTKVLRVLNSDVIQNQRQKLLNLASK